MRAACQIAYEGPPKTRMATQYCQFDLVGNRFRTRFMHRQHGSRQLANISDAAFERLEDRRRRKVADHCASFQQCTKYALLNRPVVVLRDRVAPGVENARSLRLMHDQRPEG